MAYTMDSLLATASHGRRICEFPDAQVYWRGQKTIIAFDEDNPNLINSVRIVGGHLIEVDVKENLEVLRRNTTSGLDAGDQRIYVAPTYHKNTKLTYDKCKQRFIDTSDRECKVRVAVVFSRRTASRASTLGGTRRRGFQDQNGSFLVLERDPDMSMDVFPTVKRIGQPTVVRTVEGTTVVTN